MTNTLINDKFIKAQWKNQLENSRLRICLSELDKEIQEAGRRIKREKLNIEGNFESMKQTTGNCGDKLGLPREERGNYDTSLVKNAGPLTRFSEKRVTEWRTFEHKLVNFLKESDRHLPLDKASSLRENSDDGNSKTKGEQMISDCEFIEEDLLSPPLFNGCSERRNMLLTLHETKGLSNLTTEVLSGRICDNAYREYRGDSISLDAPGVQIETKIAEGERTKMVEQKVNEKISKNVALIDNQKASASKTIRSHSDLQEYKLTTRLISDYMRKSDNFEGTKREKYESLRVEPSDKPNTHPKQRRSFGYSKHGDTFDRLAQINSITTFERSEENYLVTQSELVEVQDVLKLKSTPHCSEHFSTIPNFRLNRKTIKSGTKYEKCDEGSSQKVQASNTFIRGGPVAADHPELSIDKLVSERHSGKMTAPPSMNGHPGNRSAQSILSVLSEQTRGCRNIKSTKPSHSVSRRKNGEHFSSLARKAALQIMMRENNNTIYKTLRKERLNELRTWNSLLQMMATKF